MALKPTQKMTKKINITGFEKIDEQQFGSVTRFGGQPAWIDEPQWPQSSAWGRPMQFICQIPLFHLDDDFGGKVAFIFATHPSHAERDQFFDPDVIFLDGGENAVIIQPHGTVSVPTRPDSSGPTLFASDGASIAYSPILEPGNDPGFVSQDAFVALSGDDQKTYCSAVEGSKIGGVPAFFQGDDWPHPGEWRLLLQLEASQHRLPFFLNLGASPVLFAFVSTDGSSGKMLIQDT